MQRIIIIGEGFAGVFAALAAAGERHRSKQGAGITVELLSPDPYLTIRPRLYEAELAWGARCQRDRVRYPASRQDDWIMVQAEVDLSQLRYV